MKKQIDISYIKSRIGLITGMFVAFIVGILFVTYFMFEILSSTRAYTAYHSLWTHTQNQAVVHLIGYANSGEIEEYHSFENNLTIMDGIQNALYEINMDRFNRDIVKENFQKSALFSDDLDEKIKYMHFLRNFREFEKAFNKWENYHQNSKHLRDLALTIQTTIENNEMDEFTRQQILFLAQNLNTTLVEDQIDLLNDLNTASNNLKYYSILILIIFSGGSLFIVGVLIFNWYQNLESLSQVSHERDRIASFPKMNPSPIIVVNKKGMVTYFNEAASKELGVNIGQPSTSTLHNQLVKASNELIQSKKISQTIEISQNDRTFLVYAFKLRTEESVHFYFFDISDRKQLESKLVHSLEEKTLLLSEVHHRVKNNLAVVIGLLELEMAYSDDKSKHKIINRNISRLHSIAAVHNLLYDTQNLSHIPFDDFLNNSISAIQSQYSSINISCTVKESCMRLSMNINQAIPCAMLLNEIFESISRHNQQVQSLSVQFEAECDDNGIILCLSAGRPGIFEWYYMNEGLNLVDLLFEQMQGKSIEADKNNNELRISFHLKESRGSGNALPDKFELKQVIES